jgi:hypothetical protein
MRNAVLGGLLVAGLWTAAVEIAPGRDPAGGWPHVTEAGPSGLITLMSPAGENRQLLTVVDPRTRAVSVYHVDALNGTLSLKCVRNIHWDLQMVEFNGASPLPREIRSMLEPR